MLSTVITSACGRLPGSETPSTIARPIDALSVKARATETAFYLAPLNHRDPQWDDARVPVQSNGNAVYQASNVFNSSKKYWELNLNYDSTGYSAMQGGGWISNFTSQLDTVPDYEKLPVKSPLYASEKSACEQGWGTISNSAYRGAMAGGTVSYDSASGLCNIVLNSAERLSLIVWGRSSLPDGVHVVTQSDGNTLLFVRNSAGGFRSLTTDSVSLEPVGAAWHFTDDKGQVAIYDSSGKLQGYSSGANAVSLTYDATGKLTQASGPFGERMTFVFGGNGLMQQIEDSESHLVALLDYDTRNNLQSISLMDGVDKAVILSMTYNNAGKLEKVANPQEPSGAQDQLFTYDSFGRVSQSIALGQAYNYVYEPNRLTVTDAALAQVTTVFGTIRSVSRPLTIERFGTKQTNTYDSNGNLAGVNIVNQTPVLAKASAGAAAQSTGVSSSLNPLAVEKDSFNVDIQYDKRGRKTYASVAKTPAAGSGVGSGDANSNGAISYRYAYGKKSRQPEKIYDGDTLVFLEYNPEGRVARRTRAKVGAVASHAELEAWTKEKASVSGLKTEFISYAYDDKGQIIATNDDQGKTWRYEYDTQGAQIARIAPSGRREIRRGSNGLGAVRQAAKVPNVGTIDAKSIWAPQSPWAINNVVTPQVAFMGGAGDASAFLGFGPSNIVVNHRTGFLGATRTRFQNETDLVDPALVPNFDTVTSQIKYYAWNGLPPVVPYMQNNLFRKTNGSPLVVVGHSWGGDSAVEASKTVKEGLLDYGVDLLVTIDPVGVWDYTSGADYWVNVWVDPGPMYYTYFYVTVRRCGWRNLGFCFDVHAGMGSNWDSSDWTAWAGGKGTISSYDPWMPNYTDVYLKFPGHHKQFSEMVTNLEAAQNGAYNYNLTTINH